MDIYEQITDRIQKITSALYRVTDLLPDKEPLKWVLRNRAINVYDNLMSLRFTKDRDNLLNEIFSSLILMINILELTSMGTYISNLNFQILKKEYSALKDFIEGKKNDISQEQKLLPEFSLVSLEPLKPVHSNGHSNGQYIGHRSRKPRPVLKKIQSSGFGSREQKIIDFLKSGEPKNISEIITIFTGISEKTVQRDLLALVKTGKLKAKGEKRWRTYALAEV